MAPEDNPADELERLRDENKRLRAAIKKHHEQRADDRCFLDDAELYAAVGLAPADVRVGDKDAMLANCKRFLAQRCEGGGPWKSYAELEAENARLKEWRDSVSSAVKNVPEFHSGHWAGDKEGWGFHFELVNWLIRERDKLLAFKTYVHARLDAVGVSPDPESPHKAQGCRIGGRLDELIARPLAVFAEKQKVEAELERLRALIDCPHNDDWIEGVKIEAAHQQERWGAAHDDGKNPEDWFWLIGFLAGKALRAAIDGNADKAKHHTISTAAALLNWHRRVAGQPGEMRPGIEPPAGIESKHGG
jgi:hypothetical protein